MNPAFSITMLRLLSYHELGAGSRSRTTHHPQPPVFGLEAAEGQPMLLPHAGLQMELNLEQGQLLLHGTWRQLLDDLSLLPANEAADDAILLTGALPLDQVPLSWPQFSEQVFFANAALRSPHREYHCTGLISIAIAASSIRATMVIDLHQLSGSKLYFRTVLPVHSPSSFLN